MAFLLPLKGSEGIETDKSRTSSLVKRNLLQIQRQKIGYGAILCSYYYYYGFTDG